MQALDVVVEGSPDFAETADEKPETFQSHECVHDHVGLVGITACHHTHSSITSHSIRPVPSHSIRTSITTIHAAAIPSV